MIINIVTTKFVAGREAEWFSNLERLLVPLAQSSKGVLGVHVGNAVDPARRETVIVTLWDELSSLKRYSGQDIYAPRLSEEERWLVERRRVEVFATPDPSIE